MPEPASRSSRIAPGLERMLRHCLEKSPGGALPVGARPGLRPRGALRLDAQRCRRVPRVAPVRARGRGRSLSRPAALVLLAAGFGLGRLGRGSAAPVTSPQASFTQLTFQAGRAQLPERLARGQSFVFVSENGGDLDIHLQRVGGANADQPDRRLADGRHRARLLAGRLADRLSLRARRRRHLRDGRDRRVGAAADGRGIQPRLVPGRDARSSTAPAISAVLALRAGGFGELWAVKVASGEKRRLTPDGPRTPCSRAGHPTASASPSGACAPGGQRDLWTIARSGGEASVRQRDRRPRPRLEPGVGARRPLALLLERPRRHDGPLAPRDRRSLGARVRPAAAAGGPVSFRRLPELHARRPQRMLLAGAFAEPTRSSGSPSIPRTARARRRATTVFASSLRLFYRLSVRRRRADRHSPRAAGARTSTRLQRDGTGLRQLTNDAFKDRGPVFCPTASGCCSTPTAPASTRRGACASTAAADPAHAHGRRANRPSPSSPRTGRCWP